MKQKSFFEKLSLAFVKELPYLFFTVKKSKIVNTEALEKLQNEKFHFQFAFGMPGIDQDFANPRYENMLVTEDIVKLIRENRSGSSNISICESAPLDGYIIWRLSQLQKNMNYQLQLNALEIQKGNCEKIQLVGDVFGYKVNVHNNSIESFFGGPFDYFTMLGVTYQLSSPLHTLRHIFSKLLKPGGVFYFDFIQPDAAFNKYGFHKRENTEVEGITGVRYELADERTEEENAYYLNHPTSAVSTILYDVASLQKFFKEHSNIKFEEFFVSPSSGYTMTTYRATVNK